MFTIISSVLVGIAILAIAYVALSRAAVHLVFGPRRKEVTALSMFVTFIFGYSIAQRVETLGSQTSAVITAPPPVPAALVGSSKPRDVSAECDPKMVPSPGGSGSVDALVKASAASPIRWDEPIDRASAYSVLGWALAQSKSELAVAACLVVDGRIAMGIKSYYGAARPDVAAALKSEADMYSGFILTLPPKYLSLGPHTIRVAVKSPDRTMQFATGQHNVVVR